MSARNWINEVDGGWVYVAMNGFMDGCIRMNGWLDGENPIKLC